MVSSSNTLLEVGVDYLTVTADGGARGALVEARVIALYRDELRAGNFVRPWGMAGYTGFRVGQVEYGTRHDGCVARLRGKLAADHWPKFFAAADNCSRIDEQITVRAGGGARALLRNEYRRALRRHHTNAAAGEVDYRQSTDGGATLYLGKRVSGRFGRVYDKGVQSKLTTTRVLCGTN